MLAILVMAFTFLSVPAKAVVNEVYEKETDGGRRVYIVYDENSKCFLDIYDVPDYGLQDKVSQNRFDSCAPARDLVATEGAKRKSSKLSRDPEFVTETNEAIWEATETWNDEWEQKYADWVANEVSYHFHFDHGIATDCADGAISTRWIFARINHLAMGSTLAGSGALFTNESMRRIWKDLPTAEVWWQDQRFMAALDYILENCYTHSLIVDSYPISIEPGVFGPGSHHLNLYAQETGHTQVVTSLDGIFGIKLIYSSVPRAVRQFWVASFHEPQYNGPERGGFLKYRWAEKIDGVWRLRPGEEMPHYSLMQYSRAFMRGYGSFQSAVLAHMGISLNDPVAAFSAKLDEFDSVIATRIEIVNDGYAFCIENDCSPETAGWETWGTPHRDERIKALAEEIVDIYRSYSYDNRRIVDIANARIFDAQIMLADEVISVDELLSRFRYDYISSDPRASIRMRWGYDYTVP